MSPLTRQNRCNGIWAPIELSYLTIAVSAVFALVTVTGNVLIILVVIKLFHHESRKTFMILVVNLAVADLLVGVVVEPLSIATHVLESLKTNMTDFQTAEHVSYFLSCSVSIFTLSILALDRFFAVSRPIWYWNHVTLTKVKVVVILVWFFCIIFTALYFEIGFVLFLFVFANAAVAVTMFISFSTYILTLRRAKVSGRIFSLDQAQGQCYDRHQKTENAAIRQKAKREEKLTKIFLIMLLFVLLFYLPSCVMMYMINLCSTCSCALIHWLRDIQFFFIWANSAVNPAIYALRLPPFRRAFMNLIGCRRAGNIVNFETNVGGDH